jgi:hypothetical protein
MNTHVVGLRIASAAFGLACLAFLARLLSRLRMRPGFREYLHPGFHNGGFFPILVAIALTGILSVWMWNISDTPKAGPPPGN